MYDYACANKNKMEVIEYLIDLKHDDFDLKALYRYARKHANRGLFEVSRRLRMTQSMQSLNFQFEQLIYLLTRAEVDRI